MLKRLVLSGLILTLLLASCGVIKYSTRKVPQSKILETVKQDGLYVRLKSEDARLAAMLKYGKNAKAEKLQSELETFNSELIKNLNKNYDFSEVYFYYSKDADAIFKDKDNSKVYDRHLEVADVTISEKIGVLMAEDNKMLLHQWEGNRMVQLDKFIYRRTIPKFVLFPSIAQIMDGNTTAINMDFGLYH